MVAVVPFALDHLAALTLDGLDAWARPALADENEVAKWEGHAFTALDNGKAIGIAGLSLDDDGTARGWLIGGAALRSRPMFLHRAVKRALANVRDNPAVRRIEIVVESGCETAARWAGRLGFKPRATDGDSTLYVMES